MNYTTGYTNKNGDSLSAFFGMSRKLPKIFIQISAGNTDPIRQVTPHSSRMSFIQLALSTFQCSELTVLAVIKFIKQKQN